MLDQEGLDVECPDCGRVVGEICVSWPMGNRRKGNASHYSRIAASEDRKMGRPLFAYSDTPAQRRVVMEEIQKDKLFPGYALNKLIEIVKERIDD